MHGATLDWERSSEQDRAQDALGLATGGVAVPDRKRIRRRAAVLKTLTFSGHDPCTMTVSSRLFDADGTDQTVDIHSATLDRLTDRQLLWVDIERADERELHTVADALGVAPASVRPLLGPDREPRLDFVGDYFEMTVVALDEHEKPLVLELLAGKNWVATVHSSPVPFLGEFRQRLAPDTELGVLTAPSFLAALLDWQVGTYFAAVDRLGRAVDDLDERAFHARGRENLARDLIRLRRRIGAVRRTLTPHREVFAALARPDFEVIASSEPATHYRALVERLERAIGAVENVRELLIGSFDIFMTQIGQQTNDVMRTLTIITVILLPASVLAGVMGMNFQVGFFDDPAMFWVVVGSMVLIAVTVLLVARLKRWI